MSQSHKAAVNKLNSAVFNPARLPVYTRMNAKPHNAVMLVLKNHPHAHTVSITQPDADQQRTCCLHVVWELSTVSKSLALVFHTVAVFINERAVSGAGALTFLPRD